LASPIVRETIKKLKARRTALQQQIKGPLEELRQIEEDLEALGAASPSRGAAKRPSTRARRPAPPRAPRNANQAAILRAVRNGATTPEEIAEKTSIAAATVSRAVTTAITTSKLLTRGPNGLTLTKAGREKLAELEAR
jgi:DNA-binding NarL/FixJ family response regulator